VMRSGATAPCQLGCKNCRVLWKVGVLNMNTNFEYSIVNRGELLIRSKQNGKAIWTGRPKNSDVEMLSPIPMSDDCIVMLNWKRGSPGNVIRISPDGEILWEVERLMSNTYGVNRFNDVYVKIQSVCGTTIMANSWSGFLDTIDIDTGKVIDSGFVK
jgi:outer membrane protein assembly factor BamB